MVGVTRAERLAEFLRRLNAARPARDFPEAYGQITCILNQVEDEHAGTPFDLSAAAHDGRLYPPLWDRIKRQNPDVRRLISTNHETRVAVNGAIEIASRTTGHVYLDKPGDDGRRVRDS